MESPAFSELCWRPATVNDVRVPHATLRSLRGRSKNILDETVATSVSLSLVGRWKGATARLFPLPPESVPALQSPYLRNCLPTHPPFSTTHTTRTTPFRPFCLDHSFCLSLTVSSPSSSLSLSVCPLPCFRCLTSYLISYSLVPCPETEVSSP